MRHKGSIMTGVRLSWPERRRLEEVASRRGVTISTVLRQSIRELELPQERQPELLRNAE